jgi:aspartate racemase
MGTVIGVIGGAGVAATNKLLDIIEQCKTKDGAFRDSHHPEMIVYQAIKAPSRSMFLEGKGPSFIQSYIDVSKKLKAAGATKLCMCCNTAHFAIAEIQQAVDLPFINLIEEVALEAKKQKPQKIGLIVSDGCEKTKLYDRIILKICGNVSLVYPDADIQKEVTKGICNIKNSCRFLDESSKDRPKNIFERVKNHLTSKGSDLIIIGCTDIRVDFKSIGTIDSLEILAKRIIESYE